MTWRTATLGDLFDLKYGKALPERNRVRTGLTPVYGSNGIVGYHDKAITTGPTIVVGRKGSAGRIAYSVAPCWPIDTTYFIDDFGDSHDPRFWAYQFRCLRLDEFEKSSAIPGLNRDDAYTRECSYPDDMDEQSRIADKLDHITARLDETKTRLDTIPTILKRFRMSVLAAACSGRLTEDWRKMKDRPLDAAEHWGNYSFGDLIADGPQNGLYKPASAYGSGVMILRIDSFYDGQITDWTKLKRLRLSTEEQKQFALANGDIVVNRVNSMPYLGKSALVRNLSKPCVYESNMMRIRLDRSRVEPDYAIRYLNSPQGLVELRKNAKQAVNQASINQQDVKAVAMALPPLDEQVEIVHRIEAMFQQADAIDARYRKAHAFTDKLMPAVLAKAFRGELA